jgi:DNA-binding PadR family transcriptional regulator
VPRQRRLSPQTTAIVLALAEYPDTWRHGYDLCQALDLKPGTVYPILRRLADRALVDAAWEGEHSPGRPPRHLYRLSPAGRDLAADLVTNIPRVRPILGDGPAGATS